MKPDLMITWIKHCDYPIFRRFLQNYRDFFGKVIILFSEHNRQPYFDHFIHNSLKDIIFLDSVDNFGKDWRHEATVEMLKHSDSEWVCSIEQDFFTHSWPKLFDLIKEESIKSDLFGWMNKTNAPYIHPSFFFIKRELLDKTSKDFSPHSEINGADHFAQITYDAQKLGAKIGELPLEGLAFHQGGINQNYLEFGKQELHRPDWFYLYNYWSMRCQVPMDFKFMQLIKKVDIALRERFPEIDPTTDERKVYYE